jgi:predicted kinase
VRLLLYTDEMAVANVLVYLIGFAGVGRLTTAQKLAYLLDARIVDNHWINNPIFRLFDNDRVTPLPASVWEQTRKVRAAVLETIATLGAPHANFILTNSLADEDHEDRNIYEAVRVTAERRGALFVPVRLLCDEEQLVKRVVSPERAARMKRMNPVAAAEELRTLTPLLTHHANELTLETSAITPEATARLIYEHIGRVA